MQRARAALLFASACSIQLPPVRSTVTVAHTRHVVLIVDDLNASAVRTCVDACTTEACVAACPTAVASPGACTAADTSHAVCRAFVDNETFDRDGGCQHDDTAPGVVRTACADNIAERKRQGDAAKRRANRVAAYLLIPLAVITIIVAVAF